MRLLPGIFVLLAAATPAIAEPLPGDPVAGLAFARGVCAECHYVEREWADMSVSFAPSFAEIAESGSITELSLRVFLQTPHKEMPDLILTPQETDDVISWILSLKK